MKTTTYTCDRCKQTVPEQIDLIGIATTGNSYRIKLRDITYRPLKFELCIKCSKALGLIIPTPEKAPPTPAEDLYDKIYEMLYEIAEEAISNQ